MITPRPPMSIPRSMLLLSRDLWSSLDLEELWSFLDLWLLRYNPYNYEHPETYIAILLWYHPETYRDLTYDIIPWPISILRSIPIPKPIYCDIILRPTETYITILLVILSWDLPRLYGYPRNLAGPMVFSFFILSRPHKAPAYAPH